MLPNPSFMFCMAVGFMAQSNAAPDPIFNSIVQFGALGLCAYMVLDNKKDRDRMAKSAEFDKHALIDLSRNATEAMNKVAEAIKGCPENQQRRN